MEKEEKILAVRRCRTVIVVLLTTLLFVMVATMGRDSPPAPRVPFILHRTAKDFISLKYPLDEFHQECKEYYKEWDIKEWTDDDIDVFVRTNYPLHYRRFREMEPIIRRVDAVRYLWMYHYGGVYLDMDVECIRPLDDFVLALPPGSTAWIEGYPEPFVLMSTQGNEFWMYAFELILTDWRKYNVRSTAGPQGLNRMAKSYVGVFGVDAVRKFSISDPAVANSIYPPSDVIAGQSTWRWIEGAERFGASAADIEHKIGFFPGNLFDPTACLARIGRCRFSHCHTRKEDRAIQSAYAVHHCHEQWGGEHAG
jgi:hypothetical protein